MDLESALKRCKAEQRLNLGIARPDLAVSETDARAPLHELQVHQIEMEMTAAVPTAIVFDAEAVLSKCCDSRDMVREMIQCFFDDVDEVLPQIRMAQKTGNLAEVGRLGHRLKGTVVYLGAGRWKRLPCAWRESAIAGVARRPMLGKPSMPWSTSASP